MPHSQSDVNSERNPPTPLVGNGQHLLGASIACINLTLPRSSALLRNAEHLSQIATQQAERESVRS